MAGILPEIRRRGAGVLVVSFSPPDRIRPFLEKYPQPFPVVSDPGFEAYRAFSLGRTRWTSFFRPAIVWHYLKLIFRGWKPTKTGENDDLLQLGGDFLLDAAGMVVLAHPSRDATDRPSPATLLAALEKLS